MKRHKFGKKLICMLLCLAIVWGASERPVKAANLSSITSNTIKEKEQQILKAKDEKKQLQSGLSSLQTIKKNLESKKADLKTYVTELDKHLTEIQEHIVELTGQIEFKEKEIVQTELELEIAKLREQKQKAAMISRVRMVYEKGDPQMLDLLAKASSFGDFMNRADFVEKVVTYDQRVLTDYMNVRVYVELCEEELQLEKEILDETKAGVEEEEKNLEALIEEKKAEIVKYENDIKNQEKAIREYQAEIKAQEAEISALEALIAEEKRKILAASGVVLTFDGGTFKFPLASYTRVSDDYGDRIHPTLHVKQFHNGVDFAAPAGTAIYAAYDGVVVAATYSSTMGNYIMIDHGSGLYTIYMHASKLLVNKDDVVVRGQNIAKVGSTGRSTGNHLHFSVRKDGGYVSPWNYITQ